MAENKETDKSQDTDKAGGSVKKPYQSPEVHIYGNIREVTLGLGPKNKYDGAGPHGKGFKSLP